MATRKLFQNILEHLDNHGERNFTVLPDTVLLDEFERYSHAVHRAHGKAIDHDTPSAAGTILKKTAYVRVTSMEYAPVGCDLLDKDKRVLETISRRELVHALRFGLDMDKIKFLRRWSLEYDGVPSTLCEVLFLSSEYENSPLNRFSFVDKEDLVVAVDPNPVFVGSHGLEPMVRILSSMDYKNLLEVDRRRDRYFPRRFRNYDLITLMGYPKEVSLTELRYRLKFGQRIMPVFSYEWYTANTSRESKRQGGYNNLRAMFTDPDRYDPKRSDNWDSECEDLYERIMTRLKVCKCHEMTPPEGKSNYFMHRDVFNDLRAELCGHQREVCLDTTCGRYRDCPMGVASLTSDN